MSACWLEAQSLGLTEGELVIVDHIDMKFGAGRTAIIGPNGAGKSTLLRLLHGLLKPSRGQLKWTRPLSQGMVFQRPIMLRTTALANVEYGLHLRGLPRQVCRERAQLALERVGLNALAGRQARKLSGGEQQRIALARVWALEPELLFLDEPTASLDPASRRAVERIILDIAAGGTKVVVTTHDLGQVRRIAEEVVYLEGGQALEQTPVEQFFTQPQTVLARQFIRDVLG